MSDVYSGENVTEGDFSKPKGHTHDTDGDVLTFPTSLRFRDQPARLREFRPFRDALDAWINAAADNNISTTYTDILSQLIKDTDGNAGVQGMRIRAAYSSTPILPLFESVAPDSPLCLARINEKAEDVSVLAGSEIPMAEYQDGLLVPTRGFTMPQLEITLLCMRELVAAGFAETIE